MSSSAHVDVDRVDRVSKDRALLIYYNVNYNISVFRNREGLLRSAMPSFMSPI